jgi:F-type H+-transporting ATPase subunit b
MEIVSTIALISINATLVVQLVSFLLFLLIINRVMFRPLRNTMRERAFFIETVDEEIAAADGEHTRIMALLARQERDVRREADALRRKRRDEGAAEGRRLVDRALEQIARMHREAEADVDRQMVEARQGVTREAEQLSVVLMEKILERRIDA